MYKIIERGLYSSEAKILDWTAGDTAHKAVTALDGGERIEHLDENDLRSMYDNLDIEAETTFEEFLAENGITAGEEVFRVTDSTGRSAFFCFAQNCEVDYNAVLGYAYGTVTAPAGVENVYTVVLTKGDSHEN